ncbi:MAG: AAA family ATPase, partial [Planctomyces sp.]
MRILRITAENLASLAGLQHVDFTTEPLRSAGLFSIIGPTGSGKSTLLDALCLALYDDTPRLKLAPKGGEDIRGVSQQDPRGLLRRGAASGMAEVAFVGVDGNTWTAQWKVRRARNRAEGQLQAVTMALYRGNLQQGQEEQLEVGGKK